MLYVIEILLLTRKRSGYIYCSVLNRMRQLARWRVIVATDMLRYNVRFPVGFLRDRSLGAVGGHPFDKQMTPSGMTLSLTRGGTASVLTLSASRYAN